MPHHGGSQPAHIDTPDGPMTRRQAAAYYDLSLNTIHGRWHAGLRGEALFAPVKPKHHRQSRWVQIDGRSVRVSELFPSTLLRRSFYWFMDDRGLTPEDARDRVLYGNSRYCIYDIHTAGGVVRSNALASLLNRTGELFIRRYKRGWSAQDIVATPAYGIRGQHVDPLALPFLPAEKIVATPRWQRVKR